MTCIKPAVLKQGMLWFILCANVKMKMHLQVVGDEQLSQVIHLQHGCSIVLTDAVALQQVLGGHHLPGQPAQVESSVA